MQSCPRCSALVDETIEACPACGAWIAEVEAPAGPLITAVPGVSAESATSADGAGTDEPDTAAPGMFAVPDDAEPNSAVLSTTPGFLRQPPMVDQEGYIGHVPIDPDHTVLPASSASAPASADDPEAPPSAPEAEGWTWPEGEDPEAATPPRSKRPSCGGTAAMVGLVAMGAIGMVSTLVTYVVTSTTR